VVLSDYDMLSLGCHDMKSVSEKYNFSQFPDLYGTAQHACAFVSPLVYPFFYLTGDNHDDSKCTTDEVNQIIMNEFILPVLDIAKQENA
jgi:hypothetical protein